MCVCQSGYSGNGTICKGMSDLWLFTVVNEHATCRGLWIFIKFIFIRLNASQVADSISADVHTVLCINQRNVIMEISLEFESS